MPPEILTRLLAGEHLNIEERQSLGLRPPETLKYSDVRDHLVKILESQEWFPQPFDTAHGQSPIRDGIVVHRQNSGRYVCITQRARANDPQLLAEKTEAAFNSARAAADYYLKWELNLPGRMDGWPVL